MVKSFMFQLLNQVQVILKLLVWIITLKEKFSTKGFVFDPGGFISFSTLNDSYDSRMDYLQEGENDIILIRA